MPEAKLPTNLELKILSQCIFFLASFWEAFIQSMFSVVAIEYVVY